MLCSWGNCRLMTLANFINATCTLPQYSASLPNLKPYLEILSFTFKLWHSPSRWESNLLLASASVFFATDLSPSKIVHSPWGREAETWMFITFILLNKCLNYELLRALVSKSASWVCVGVKNSLTTLSCTLSLTTWQSTSMRLVLSWNTGFSPI